MVLPKSSCEGSDKVAYILIKQWKHDWGIARGSSCYILLKVLSESNTTMTHTVSDKSN